MSIQDQARKQLAQQRQEDEQRQDAMLSRTEEELQTLSGIGPAKAAAIVRDREENGPFKTEDDLTRVSGIGEKTLENIREEITVK